MKTHTFYASGENTTDFLTSKDDGHLHHAELANLAAMARSIFHQVGATEVTHPELTTLVSFNGTNGDEPCGGLIADAHGDLFGTTTGGGAYGDGTVFEIAKTAHGYASTPTTLVSFDGTNGARPFGSLIADAHGDLFGTTVPAARLRRTRRRGHGVRDRQDCSRLRQHPHHPGQLRHRQRCESDRQPDRRRPRRPIRHNSDGGANGATSMRHGVRDRQDRPRLRQHPDYPGQLQRHANGANPYAGLIADAHGDLFGTTVAAGRTAMTARCSRSPRPPTATPAPPPLWSALTAPTVREPVRQLDRRRPRRLVRHSRLRRGGRAHGTVFEIVKTAHGYASTPTTLVSFN